MIRRNPLRATAWVKPERRFPTPQEKPRAAVVGSIAAEALVQTAKGPAAKPGKRSPTVDEARWMDAITAFGCIACFIDGHAARRTAVHHILRGGVRLGHRFSLPLCDPGHHQNGAALGLVSRHPDKAAFERRYGSEFTLLGELQALLQFEATA